MATTLALWASGHGALLGAVNAPFAAEFVVQRLGTAGMRNESTLRSVHLQASIHLQLRRFFYNHRSRHSTDATGRLNTRNDLIVTRDAHLDGVGSSNVHWLHRHDGVTNRPQPQKDAVLTWIPRAQTQLGEATHRRVGQFPGTSSLGHSALQRQPLKTNLSIAVAIVVWSLQTKRYTSFPSTTKAGPWLTRSHIQSSNRRFDVPMGGTSWGDHEMQSVDVTIQDVMIKGTCASIFRNPWTCLPAAQLACALQKWRVRRTRWVQAAIAMDTRKQIAPP